MYKDGPRAKRVNPCTAYNKLLSLFSRWVSISILVKKNSDWRFFSSFDPRHIVLIDVAFVQNCIALSYMILNKILPVI